MFETPGALFYSLVKWSFVMTSLSEYILYKEGASVENEAVACLPLIERFCQRGCGGEEDDGLVMDLLFTQTRGDKKAKRP